MNRYLLYILMIVLGIVCFACTDDKLIDDSASQKARLHLTLNLPAGETRVSGTDTNTPYLDPETKEQRYINDVFVLVMKEGIVTYIPIDVTIDNQQGEAARTISMTVPSSHDLVDVMVLLNPVDNGISVETLKGLKDKSEADVREALVFDYPTERPWDISKTYLPMWGKAIDVNVSSQESYGYCDVYRSVAKMAVQVDAECKNFQLKEVYLYYMEQKGYLMSQYTPNEDEKIQYTQPDVPSVSSQTGLENAVEYSVTDNAIINKIYLPESNNKDLGENKKQLKMVVGGVFCGEGLVENDGNSLSYYRIDMSDDKDSPYDIIRNHSYIYNITAVDNPGTPSPDKALDHSVPALDVEVADWTDEYLRGVPDQYTLRTDKSVITLDSYTDVGQHTFKVWTDYGRGWSIETEEGQIVDTNGNPIEWLNIDRTNGNYNEEVTISINANKINTGVTRTNRFWIKAGNIRKEMTVIMPQPPTANCYVVGSGYYEIIVSIKGNGADGTRPENVDIVDGNPATNPTDDAKLEPDMLGIIWETKKGLISLYDWTAETEDRKYVDGNNMDKPMVQYNPDTSTLGFSVKANIEGATIGGKPGGNALIGAFKNVAEEGEDPKYEVIWSWHIWVCPEMYDPSTGQIKENEYLENWTISGYQFLDRNLGALASKPTYVDSENGSSVATMGLQYQWGRKDPFIGPKYSNDNFTDNDNGLLYVKHYYEPWGVNGSSSNNDITPLADGNRNINYTIAHPTQLVYWNYSEDNQPTALVSLTNGELVYGELLWGTNDGLNENVKELGTKTIYDPCPVGYRVPPVDAFIFKSPNPIGYKTKSVKVPDYQSSTRNRKVLDLGSNRIRKKNLDGHYGKEYVFIQWYKNAQPITAPHYYRRLTETNVVIPNDATHFKIIAGHIDETDGEQPMTTSSFDNNFNWNMVNIPFNVVADNDLTRYYDNTNDVYSYLGKFYGSYGNQEKPKKTMIGDALYYGFYMNYANMDEPKMKNGTHLYELDDKSNITWLPLTGAYNPTKGITFRSKYDSNEDGESEYYTIPVEAGSSITVNSFLWTNSSVDKNGTKYPAGIALHGAEPRGDYDTYYGRHIHGLRKTDVQADRHYTSAVRCIKDVKKVTWDEVNSLTEKVTMEYGKAYYITLKSVNGAWKLVDPGAPWLLVTPDKGEANGGNAENNIELKMIKEMPKGTTTTLKFQIEGETNLRECIVTVK